MTEEDERYFRDIYDHLIRISDLIDTYRDLLTSSMDVYLSTVSNRLNAVMKQLTIMATIFLPLTFVTGFFGQNFGWMVGHIRSAGIFFGARHRPRGRHRRRALHAVQETRLVLASVRTRDDHGQTQTVVPLSDLLLRTEETPAEASV